MLISIEVQYPDVHDLARLLSLLDVAGVSIPGTVRNAAELTPFALITRYPGVTRPVTEPDYRAAVKTAVAVVRWAEERI